MLENFHQCNANSTIHEYSHHTMKILINESKHQQFRPFRKRVPNVLPLFLAPREIIDYKTTIVRTFQKLLCYQSISVPCIQVQKVLYYIDFEEFIANVE